MRWCMRRLRNFLRLPSAERRLLVRAALLLGTVRLGLWLLPFQTLRHLLTRLSSSSIRSHDPERPSKESVVWAVETAGRRITPAATCLTLALTAQVLLLRRGYPAILHIGAVKVDGEQFLAHAWLESQGKIVIGGYELERYTPLAALEGLSVNHIDVRTTQSKAGLR
jgi:hypothetical protein